LNCDIGSQRNVMKLENPAIGVVDWSRTPAIIQGGETGAATARTCELWRHHVASRRLQFPASSQTIGAIKATSDHRTAFYAKPARLASSSIEPQGPQVSLMLQSYRIAAAQGDRRSGIVRLPPSPCFWSAASEFLARLRISLAPNTSNNRSLTPSGLPTSARRAFGLRRRFRGGGVV